MRLRHGLNMTSPALTFSILSECGQSKARHGRMCLPHGVVETPVFMPVGTQGSMKGLTPGQVEEVGVEILLGNTYHLGHRPGAALIERGGGLHRFMAWNKPLLTDSGGFQMVSLSKLSEVTEEGVRFVSPHNNSEMLLTPESCVQLQNSIGADIIMQLDDVVSSTTTGPRVEEAMHRSVRWLDRCIAAHKQTDKQNLFPIVQGGLDADLRRRSVKELVKRESPGYAIGGLSGGESKGDFWQMVTLSTDQLPRHKPRYLMGVGFAVDLVVCVALGCDMFDCVYPTRTARFGQALVPWGCVSLKQASMKHDHRPIDDECPCLTCRTYTRSYLYHLVTRETVACHLVTMHNLTYQVRLMRAMRSAITEARFPEFVQAFMLRMFPQRDYPQWASVALASVNIQLV